MRQFCLISLSFALKFKAHQSLSCSLRSLLGSGFGFLGFLLRWLLRLVFFGLLGVEVRQGGVRAEGHLAEYSGAGSHLEEEVGVASDVGQRTLRLLVKHELEAGRESAYKQCISDRHRVANEEVAQGEVGVQGCQRLL